jgi:hypothetical protein
MATEKTTQNGKLVYFLQIKSLVLVSRENAIAIWEVVYENGVTAQVSFPVTTTWADVAELLRNNYVGST